MENRKTPRLKEFYAKEVQKTLKNEFKITNNMQVPKMTKVVLNIGLGEAIQNPKTVESAVADLTAITGQKPVITIAKKSIAGFKLREGMPIGTMVTLRNDRMWEFMDRLFSLALPRVRDFRGVPNKLDGNGNYTMGLKEQIVFQEIQYENVDKLRGMNITFHTTATNDEQGKSLLANLGMPFRK